MFLAVVRRARQVFGKCPPQVAPPLFAFGGPPPPTSPAPGASMLLPRFHIDDVVDAFAVHGAGGTWAVIATGIFGDPAAGIGGNGLIYGGDQLRVQFLGALIIILWSFCGPGQMHRLTRRFPIVITCPGGLTLRPGRQVARQAEACQLLQSHHIQNALCGFGIPHASGMWICS